MNPNNIIQSDTAIGSDGRAITVPADAGYHFGQDMGNMDPIVDPTDLRRVAFEDPNHRSRSRSRSHSRSQSRSHSHSRSRSRSHSRGAANAIPPYFAQQASNVPSVVDPRDGQGYVVFGTEGTRLTSGFTNQPAVPSGLSNEVYRSSPSLEKTRNFSPDPRSRHLSRRQRATRGLSNANVLSSIIAVLQAPIEAVERQDMKMGAIFIEAIVLLAVFNWITSLFGGLWPTIAIVVFALAMFQVLSSSDSSPRRTHLVRSSP